MRLKLSGGLLPAEGSIIVTGRRLRQVQGAALTSDPRQPSLFHRHRVSIHRKLAPRSSRFPVRRTRATSRNCERVGRRAKFTEIAIESRPTTFLNASRYAFGSCFSISKKRSLEESWTRPWLVERAGTNIFAGRIVKLYSGKQGIPGPLRISSNGEDSIDARAGFAAVPSTTEYGRDRITTSTSLEY